MLRTEVQNRITQMNPWVLQPEQGGKLMARYIPDPYVTRDAEAIPATPNKASVLVGPRQSGKSTMVWHAVHPFAPGVLYLNMEDPLLRMGLVSPFDFVELFRTTYSFIKVLFLDEVQHMEEAGL